MCKKTPTELLNDLVAFTTTQSYFDEDWKEIPNTYGLYYVSNYGRILALNRKTPYLRKLDTNNTTSYARIGITIDKHRRNFHVHLLVA